MAPKPLIEPAALAIVGLKRDIETRHQWLGHLNSNILHSFITLLAIKVEVSSGLWYISNALVPTRRIWAFTSMFVAIIATRPNLEMGHDASSCPSTSSSQPAETNDRSESAPTNR
ncbi:hypothetical protein CCACVL1_08228 [Corchorus capsularis]|uniref:Uncharacterized protein n=1 Tax=Corchorus capsularis TaxID=210143 RepID=A0A1R3J1Q1_COCAP|nr:hypothetical protein CCACVL1_08228 [Corchorus capsularis]